MTPRLNRKLTLETPVRVPDGGGGYTESWAALGTLWADVTARTGRERSEQGALLSATRCRIVVRAAPVGDEARPLPQQRFRDGTRIYGIQAVADLGADGRFLICFADEEVVA